MKNIFTKKQIILLLILWLCLLVSFVTRLSWAATIAIISNEFNFSVLQISTSISVFYLGYTLTVLPGGILADRYGYRKVILLTMLGISIVTFTMSLIQGYYSSLGTRFLLGIVSGPLHASCLGAIGHNFSKNQRGLAVGIFMTCTSLGISVVNFYAPSVAVNHGYAMAFVVTAILPSVVLLVSYFAIKEHRQTQITSASLPSKKKKLIEGDLKLIFKDKNIVLLGIIGMLATGTTWGVINWANLYMVKQLNVSPVFAGKVMFVFGVSAFFAKPIAGFLSDVLPIRKAVFAAIVLFIFSPALILFGLNTQVSNLYLFGAFLGASAFMYSALTNALSVHIAPANMRATSAGFVNLFNQIGALCAPLLLGKILVLTGSYQYSFYIIAIFPVIAAALLMIIRTD